MGTKPWTVRLARLGAGLVMDAALAVAGAAAWAQAPPPAQAQSPAPSQAPPSAQAPGAPTFKAEEIEALVAPIALYPDSLLSQVLMASTYPLEIVQAARWAKGLSLIHI